MEEAKPVRDRGDGKMIYGPSGAPIWNSPAIDAKRGVLYVGTGEATSGPARADHGRDSGDRFERRPDSLVIPSHRERHLSHRLRTQSRWLELSRRAPCIVTSTSALR